MSQMILEYDEFCMFLLNIEVFNIMTPDFPYTSENETKCPILYQKFSTKIICHWISLKLARFIAFVADFKEFNLKI
jgi:hypothetical protein